MSRYEDKASIVLSNQLNAEVLEKAERFAFQSLQPIVDAEKQKRLSRGAYECTAPVASTILRDSIIQVTKELKKWVNGYSGIRWIWMLRRLPLEIVFKGKLSTTTGYDSMLAEVISGQSSQTRQDMRLNHRGVLRYSLEGAVITRLARFCSGVRFLSDLHSCFRWAGKGANFRFESGKIPSKIADAGLRSAVKLYDNRVAMYMSQPLNRLGGAIVTFANQPEECGYLLFVGRGSLTSIPVPRPGFNITNDNKSSERTIVKAEFCTFALPLAPLEKLLHKSQISALELMSKETASLIYLMFCSPLLLRQHYAGFLSVATTGYLIWDFNRLIELLRNLHDGVPEFIHQILRECGIKCQEEIISLLNGIKGSEWPLKPGPVFRFDKDVVCVDLYAASKRLNTSFQFPALQGEIANVRAANFEDQVQYIIDESVWAPTQAIRKLQGRTLRINGKAITNIDALGERNGTLLLVSCKSLIYSDNYDIGDYRTVRNVESVVKHAVSDWDSIIDKLGEIRVGDNYNFSAYHTIYGVVCTPTVVFVNSETANRFVIDELRASLCVVELANWLGVYSENSESETF